MRRISESSQYHDETPRRRVRRTPSHDSERHHSNDIKVARSLDGTENVPTSPYSQNSFQYLGPHGVSTSPSPTRSVQPVSPHRSMNYPHHGFQRSFSQPVGSTGEMSPRSPFPHSVVSPSHYPSSPMYVSPAQSPSAPPSTPSCATPSSVTYTLSRGPGSVSPRGSGLKTPDFYPGMPDASQLSPADPNFPLPYSSEPFANPREQQFVYSGGGPSPGGTIHHLGYNTPHRSQPLQSPTLFPNQPSPGRNQPAGNPLNPHGSMNIGRNHSVTNRGDKSAGLSSDLSETAKLRQLVIGYYNGEIEPLKANFREKLQELYFLQTGGNMMDFLIWKKRPSSQFLQFLNSNRLDDSSGMNPTLSTITVSPSSRLPQSFMWPQQQSDASNAGAVNYAALQRQVYEQAGLDPRKPMPGNFNTNPSYKSQISDGIAPNVSPFTGNQPISRSNVVNTVPPFSRSVSLPNPPLEINVPSGHGSNHFGSDAVAVPPVPNNHVSGVNAVHSGMQSQAISNGPTVHPPGTRPTINTRGQSLSSMIENSFSSQEDIAVEAKKEAEVLKRVAELRKEGIWSLTRLPKVQETSRCKAHWDYLLEEMTWLATDFAQERRWKRGICKKVCVNIIVF